MTAWPPVRRVWRRHRVLGPQQAPPVGSSAAGGSQVASSKTLTTRTSLEVPPPRTSRQPRLALAPNWGPVRRLGGLTGRRRGLPAPSAMPAGRANTRAVHLAAAAAATSAAAHPRAQSTAGAPTESQEAYLAQEEEEEEAGQRHSYDSLCHPGQHKLHQHHHSHSEARPRGPSSSDTPGDMLTEWAGGRARYWWAAGGSARAPLLVLVAIIILAACTPAALAVDCFKCSSRNGSNPACEDPFHNLNSTRVITPTIADPPPNVVYHTPCYAGKKGRDGLFPASTCIKLTGTFDNTGETLVVRHCALDSGTLTQDTELARMSHCGKFQFEGDLLKGCVLVCPEDACNSVPPGPRAVSWSLAGAAAMTASWALARGPGRGLPTR